MEESAFVYLRQLNIPVSKNYFEKRVVAHPDYPSLLSLSDTMRGLGIGHKVARVNEDKLDAMPFPYLLQLDAGGGKLLEVNDKKDLKNHKEELKYWKGVVIKAEPTGQITDEENNKAYIREKIAGYALVMLGVALTGLFIIPLLNGFTIPHILLRVAAACGLITGGILLGKDIGIKYKPVESFCNAGKRSNCDRILNAEDAKLFNLFTFSDATFIYFAFQLTILGLSAAFAGGTLYFPYAAVLSVLGILALPVVVYSLYYQYFKAKTWCRLCLIVDAVLGVQAALFITMYITNANIWQWQVMPLFTALFIFLTIAVAVILLKDRLVSANDSTQAETAALRVKHDPVVFTHLLSQEAKADTTPFEQEIRLGNSNAPVQVVMALNLHCHPCSVAYNQVRQIYNSYPNDVAFSFRLLPSIDDIRVKRMSNHMMGDIKTSNYFIRYWEQYINHNSNGKINTQHFIGDWYEGMDKDIFLKLYSNKLTNKSKIIEEQHYAWIKQNKITRTPTFFINGYEMPQHYALNDLMVMTPGLAVTFEKAMNEEMAE